MVAAQVRGDGRRRVVAGGVLTTAAREPRTTAARTRRLSTATSDDATAAVHLGPLAPRGAALPPRPDAAPVLAARSPPRRRSLPANRHPMSSSRPASSSMPASISSRTPLKTRSPASISTPSHVLQLRAGTVDVAPPGGAVGQPKRGLEAEPDLLELLEPGDGLARAAARPRRGCRGGRSRGRGCSTPVRCRPGRAPPATPATLDRTRRSPPRHDPGPTSTRRRCCSPWPRRPRSPARWLAVPLRSNSSIASSRSPAYWATMPRLFSTFAWPPRSPSAS